MAGQGGEVSMAKVCVLLLTLVVAVLGQTSSDLSAKYPQVPAYKVRPDVLMTARFAADGQVCEMTVEKRETTDTGIRFGDSFSEKEVQGLIDDLVPQNERGRNLTRALNEEVDCDFITTNLTYENAFFRVYGILRPKDAAGNKVIIITWPKRPCAESLPAAR
jgi:hypothetical protein